MHLLRIRTYAKTRGVQSGLMTRRWSVPLMNFLHLTIGTTIESIILRNNCGCVYTLQFAIAYNIDINKEYINFTLLERAVQYGNLLALNILIAHGADVNSSSGWPLCYAVRMHNTGSVVILNTLIMAGVDVNCTPPACRSAIEAAILSSTYETVSKLLAAGAVLPDDALEIANTTCTHRCDKIRIITEHINRTG